MKLTHLSPTAKLKILALLSISLIGLSAFTAGAHTLFASKPESAAPPSAKISSTTDPQNPRPTADVELLTLRDSGFGDCQRRRAAGRFLLVVYNRTGLAEVPLRLDRETGQQVHAAGVARGRSRYREMLDLQPGRYVLRAADRPEWTCRFTISPR